MAEPKASSSGVIKLPNFNKNSPSMKFGLLNSSNNSSGSRRLESFKAPRDYNLSKASFPLLMQKTNKRKFEPNINISKVKIKIENVEEESHRKDKKKRKRDDKNNRYNKDNKFKGRFKHEEMYIQTHGTVFDDMFEGKPVHRVKNRSGLSRSGITSTYVKRDIGPKPYFKVQELEPSRDDIEDEDDTIKRMKDYNVDVPKNKPKPGDIKPLNLPFRTQENKIKAEFYIKEELNTEEFSFLTNVKQEIKNEIDEIKPETITHGVDDMNVNAILAQSPGTFFLLQFPDTLPGHVEADVETKTSTSASEPPITTICKKSVPCTLKDLGEGLLGHIEIMASGKVRLNLGNGRFMNLDAGTTSSNRQELVSIDVDVENKTGSMKELGSVNGHIIISPDWESELKNM